jgi:sugar porter (SP) family MFS transporter
MARTPGRLIALSAATGGLFGYMIAVSNDAIDSVRSELQLTAWDAAVVVSSLVAGALIGCAIAGTAADRVGRRLTIMGAAAVALVGVALTAVATGPAVMQLGRLVTGVAVGITSAVAPLFLAELAPFARRGTILTTYQLFITVGILVAFAIGVLLAPARQWRWMFAIGGMTALAQIVAAVLVPSSPRFLVRRGQVDQARAALQRMRPADEVEPELAGIVSAAQEEVTPPLREMFSARFRPGFVVAIVMALMNALVGVSAVIYYSTDVFRAAGIGGTNGAEIASLAVGGVNFLAAIVSVVLTDRFGRRPLLSIGLVGIAVCLAAAGFILVRPGAGQGGVLVAAILGYMAFFAISAGPLAWLLLAEVLPGSIRARAAAIATAANWGANLLITLLFPLVVGTPAVSAHVGMAFWFFGVLTLGFLLFVRLRVPETRGRTLERIEADLRDRVRTAPEQS